LRRQTKTEDVPVFTKFNLRVKRKMLQTNNSCDRGEGRPSITNTFPNWEKLFALSSVFDAGAGVDGVESTP
jgi:hypothetical protein